nr:hypothetical protein CKG001_17610 [Bdellovibrio sp. CKG001]
MQRDNVQSFEAAKTLVENSQDLAQASIQVQAAQRPQNVFRVVLDLSKERSEDDPYSVLKHFKSVLFESSTDQKAEIFMRPISKSQEQDYFALRYRDSWAVSTVVANAHFHWSKQPGVKVTLVFFSDAEFRSGSQMSITSGGVSINEGSSVSGPLHVNLAAGVAAEIAPQDFFRKVAVIQNKTGADLFLGANNTVNATTNEGLKVPPDGFFEWRNTGALYGFSSGGGKVSRIEEQ